MRDRMMVGGGEDQPGGGLVPNHVLWGWDGRTRSRPGNALPILPALRTSPRQLAAHRVEFPPVHPR